MSIEPFSEWFRRHSCLSYYGFMLALDNRNKMSKLLSPNNARKSAKNKLKNRRLRKKRRSKTRVGRLKELL